MKDLVETYNPDWKRWFDDIRNILTSALNEYSSQIRIEHIGSTSISGMIAKPILDIDIIIDDKSLVDRISIHLQNLGYIDRGEQGIPGRFAFRQSTEYVPKSPQKTRWINHHLYVCYRDSLALKNHLLFRDALINNNDLVLRYSQMKLNLVNERGMTREKYTIRKTEFILDVLAKLGLSSSEIKEINNANS